MTTKAEAKNQIGQEFIITREFDAPRELVWKACTEAKQVAQWWGPHGFTAPICEWEARPGNKIYVVMRGPDGTDYPMAESFMKSSARTAGDNDRGLGRKGGTDF